MAGEITQTNHRKPFIDNIRWITVVLVVAYHVVYVYNSGIIPDLNIVSQLNVFCWLVYPWFMAALFLVAGISSRYSLQKRSNREFAKERAQRLLVPSIAGIFLLGWIAGSVILYYHGAEMFGNNASQIPGPVQYLLSCFFGMGPLWFAHELFLASMILLLIRVIDKKDRLWMLCGKLNMIGILLLGALVWGSSQILNTPYLTVYRNGIYIFTFLLGYFVFSHDKVLEKLKKWHLPLGIAALVIAAAYIIYHFDANNYTELAILNSPFTNLYVWSVTLALLGCGQQQMNFETKFTRYMSRNSFNIYVLHYPIVIGTGWLLIAYFHLPFVLNYAIVLLSTIILLPLLIEFIKRIPVLRFLLLGMSKKETTK